MKKRVIKTKKTNERARIKKIIGLGSSALAILVWLFVALISLLYARFYNIDMDVDLFDFVVVPSVIIAGTVFMVLTNLLEKLRLRSKYLTYIAIMAHGVWGIYVSLHLPDEFNGFIAMFISISGFLFVHPVAGFISTLAFSACMGIMISIVIYTSNIHIGVDEQVFFTCFAFLSISIAALNGFARKSRRLLFKAKNALQKSHGNLEFEVKKQTVELRNKNAKLRTLDKQKTHFFQNISHELRTPLTLILNSLELEISDNKSENISLASKNSYRLLRLVNQLLDFQKLSNSDNEMKLAPLNIAPFIQGCATYFTSICEKQKIKLLLDIHPSDDLIILGQSDAVEKILFNYLSNALKYTPENGTIELSLRQFGDNKVRLAVKDSGVGISKEDQQKLFKTFSQVDELTSKSYGNTGLGLALAKELAKAMSGDVGVDSEHGYGSTFWAEFPLERKENQTVDILIVDDDTEALGRLENLIIQNSEQELSLKLANSAAHGRKILSEYRVKLILSDFNMPIESGASFPTYAAKDQPKSIRFLLTAAIETSLPLDAINSAGIKEVIYKPINENIVEKLLGYLAESPYLAETENSSDFEPKDWLLSDIDSRLMQSKDAEVETQIKVLPGNSQATVLIVDDIIDMRSVISKTMIRHGFTCISAANGKQGLEVCKNHQPDIIISDWMMPVMDGPEFVKQLRNDESISSIPVVMLTAKSDDESKLLGKEAGANAYVGKPFDELELVTAVKNLLALKEKEAEIKELNRHLTENVLKRFLPEQLVEDIVNGKSTLNEEPQLQPVTFLSVDLCDFSHQSIDLSPKKLTKAINIYLSQITDTIYGHSGSINKMDGDHVTAMFGAPITLEATEQAQNAFECAQTLVNDIDKLNASFEKENLPTINMRVAIHHGPAIVGYMGSNKRSEYTAIGQSVVIASQLMYKTEPNAIFFTEIIRDLLSSSDWEVVRDITFHTNTSQIAIFKYKERKLAKAS